MKALAWSPHQHGLLASGGGTADQHIRFWNTSSGAELTSVNTGSQVPPSPPFLPGTPLWEGPSTTDSSGGYLIAISPVPLRPRMPQGGKDTSTDLL